MPDSRTSTHTFSFSVVPSSRLSGVLMIGSPTPRCPTSFDNNFVLIGAGSIPDDGLFAVSIKADLGSRARFGGFLCGGKDNASFLNFSGNFHDLGNKVGTILDPVGGNCSLLGGKLGGS